ncbi:MAG: SOS response-associated peptidase [Candidatus Kapabacteria bacterium]|nr:SOS response-associated peptidase [Candidatus Kapabacteria bacterium]
MCGRFALSIKTKDVEKLLPQALVKIELIPNYNIVPASEIICTLSNSSKELTKLRWGLIPSFYKETALGSPIINSRMESIAEKPFYKKMLGSQRCIIYANGFYEWEKKGKISQPYYISLKDESPFTFAGIWDAWKASDGTTIVSTSIITTEANELIQGIHHRMPVILDDVSRSEWLDKSLKNSQQLLNLLKPYNSDGMKLYPISKLVNNPRNNSEELIKPLSAELFQAK